MAETYGEITYISKEGKPETTCLVELIQATFTDNRLISVGKTEEGNYILAVENPESSGRNPKAVMHLSEESFIGLFASACLYFEKASFPIGKKMEELIKNKMIEYKSSFDKK